MAAPTFSVVVSTYNRAEMVSRCVASVLASSWSDFELIVVDDGSDDGTATTLRDRFLDPRLRIIVLAANEGMSEARRVGSEAARGEWVVVLDSDWELEPAGLDRIHTRLLQSPPNVRVLWFRMRWDDGRVSPAAVPPGIADYRAKLRWWESPDAGDAVRCVRREVFLSVPYHARRRGAIDTLYELDLARREPALYCEEIVAVQHADAANSWLRTSDPRLLLPRLSRDAPDMLWMAETALARHGEALARLAPSVRLMLLRTAALQAFILGRRRSGVRHAGTALRAAPRDISLWATLAVGLVGPGLTRWAVLWDRRVAQRRRTRSRGR